ncbi:hypothetical protein E2C01_024531 [Portunus trituberculatus]|uniref:Uncharacterized protein n=1 Tax=Portunus trituberculatus TaxID=210409 RepID=A0A5B7ED35_PORTR|nr:hypothetical protein [Portunus trituberculatus]
MEEEEEEEEARAVHIGMVRARAGPDSTELSQVFIGWSISGYLGKVRVPKVTHTHTHTKVEKDNTKSNNVLTTKASQIYFYGTVPNFLKPRVRVSEASRKNETHLRVNNAKSTPFHPDPSRVSVMVVLLQVTTMTLICEDANYAAHEAWKVNGGARNILVTRCSFKDDRRGGT